MSWTSNDRAVLRTVAAVRYVTPLREGGSLPAIVEGDDAGLYVLKFRGAGQGAKVLVAELLAGELGRALGLPVPEIVFMTVDADLARTEPDSEIQDLIRASAGLNIALDYLPGSIMFDPLVMQPDAGLASRIVWFDAYIANVDRTARNTNMLLWHRQLYLIDHGAALYFHHAWQDPAASSRDPFRRVADHVLLPFASELAAADLELRSRVSVDVIARLVDAVPAEWLLEPHGQQRFATADEYRAAYARYFIDRLESGAFLEEAIRAQARCV